MIDHLKPGVRDVARSCASCARPLDPPRDELGMGASRPDVRLAFEAVSYPAGATR
jgi:hypothetical protein